MTFNFNYEDFNSVMQCFAALFPAAKADPDLLSVGVKMEDSAIYLTLVVKEASAKTFYERHTIPRHFPADVSSGTVKVRFKHETKPLVQAVKPLRSKTPFRPQQPPRAPNPPSF